MQFFTRSLTIFFLTLSVSICVAQKITRVKKSPIVCYATAENIPTRVNAPASFGPQNGKTKTANIEVTYNGFSPQAQTAFQTAVDIWEGLLTSPVTIRVQANWTNLGVGVLGSAGPTFFVSDFDGAPQMNVGYPGPLAEKLAGKNLNGAAEFDISANFNSNFNWYYNSVGTPDAGQYDLISVILHELGHGLGFVDSYNYGSGFGVYGSFNGGVPLCYDLTVENETGQNLYENFAQLSTNLGGQLVSNNLYSNTPLILDNNSGQRARIYAPATWSGGSSIAHLNEATYLRGDINSLMSPQFAAQEVIHDPGPITLNLFRDMGWATIYIDHEPIESTEDINSPAFNVFAIVKDDNSADYSLETEDIYLHYKTSLNPTVLSTKMNSTGTPNEYTATLPAPGGVELEYFYYISADDNLNRTITKPGKVNTPLQESVQGYFSFKAGVDTEAPEIDYTPIEHLSFLNKQVKIQALITERFDPTVELEYSLAGMQQPTAAMTFVEKKLNPLTGLTTSLYEIELSTSSLSDGDEFAYKIIATDNSSNLNSASHPENDMHRLTFVGLKTLQNSYKNDFNDLVATDFVGDENEFSIKQQNAFDNPAIHSVHPYPIASDEGVDELNFTYTLRVPIKVRSIEATIKFDEVVLIEPGEPGAPFGTPDFYDYVVVEASKNGGDTWTHIADGYDSRDFAPWLTKYNSSIDGSGNSNAAGDASLYRVRKINLLNKFSVGDELIIRFRLLSDAGAYGWGWAIDNLKIQFDDEFPELLHKHVDYIPEGTAELSLASEISDNIGIDKIILELGFNEQPTETQEETINSTAAEITFTVEDLENLSVGDKIIYKIIATDTSGNTTTIPAEGYIEVRVVELHGEHLQQYANDFNSETNDFVGNFFSVTQPAGFTDGAIHSNHDYPVGFSPDHTSEFTYTLMKPIELAANNTRIRFDEIVIVEGHGNGVVFGTPAFNDYVIVEGSKDEGETWLPFVDGYDAKDQTAWQNAFNNSTDGSPELFRSRVIDMTENGNFAAEDHVLVRFRMFTDNQNNGWGWAIDNLYIQDAVTGTPEQLEAKVSIYPNPAKGNITVLADGINAPSFKIQLISSQGQNVYSAIENVVDGKLSHTISSASLPAGIYMVKMGDGTNSIVRKVVKLD